MRPEAYKNLEQGYYNAFERLQKYFRSSKNRFTNRFQQWVMLLVAKTLYVDAQITVILVVDPGVKNMFQRSKIL